MRGEGKDKKRQEGGEEEERREICVLEQFLFIPFPFLCEGGEYQSINFRRSLWGKEEERTSEP